MFKSRALRYRAALVLAVLLPWGSNPAKVQALEHYQANPQAVFTRALLFGQSPAIETFIAEEHPDLDMPLDWEGGTQMRPLSLVLSQLDSPARYRLQRNGKLSPPADENELSYLLLRFGAQSVYQEPHLNQNTPVHLLLKLPAPMQQKVLPLVLRFHGEANLQVENAEGQTPAALAKNLESPLAPFLEKYKATGMSDYQIRSAPFAYAKGERIYQQLAREQNLVDAVQRQQWKQVDHWLEQGVSPDTYLLYPNGMPLLHWIARLPQDKGLERWIAHEANFQIINLQRQQVLHVLVQHTPQGFDAHTRLQALLDAGADLNAQDEQGNTPLHLAQKANQQIWVDLLVKAGANPGLRNHAGQKALP